MELARDVAIEIVRERGYDGALELARQVIPALAAASRKD
jgi:hypothetical protein